MRLMLPLSDVLLLAGPFFAAGAVIGGRLALGVPVAVWGFYAVGELTGNWGRYGADTSDVLTILVASVLCSALGVWARSAAHSSRQTDLR